MYPRILINFFVRIRKLSLTKERKATEHFYLISIFLFYLFCGGAETVKSS